MRTRLYMCWTATSNNHSCPRTLISLMLACFLSNKNNTLLFTMDQGRRSRGGATPPLPPIIEISKNFLLHLQTFPLRTFINKTIKDQNLKWFPEIHRIGISESIVCQNVRPGRACSRIPVLLNQFVCKPIWARARTKPATLTADSCFGPTSLSCAASVLWGGDERESFFFFLFLSSLLGLFSTV